MYVYFKRNILFDIISYYTQKITFKKFFTFAGILCLLRSVFFNLHYLFIL